MQDDVMSEKETCDELSAGACFGCPVASGAGQVGTAASRREAKSSTAAACSLHNARS